MCHAVEGNWQVRHKTLPLELLKSENPGGKNSSDEKMC